MSSVVHYHNTYNHSSFDFIPRQYRDIIKIVLLVPLGLALLITFLFLGQSM